MLTDEFGKLSVIMGELPTIRELEAVWARSEIAKEDKHIRDDLIVRQTLEKHSQLIHDLLDKVMLKQIHGIFLLRGT